MTISKRISSLHCYPYLIITSLVVLVYLPTFTGEFILDDKPLIEKNSYIRELHSVWSYLMQEDGVHHKYNKETYHTGYYRPLINLSYWIDYKLWGMSAPGFRSTNFFLHLLSCFVLFRFIVLLVSDRQAAFWATVLFALHPVNTEAVSWITSRNNILVTLFALLSFCFYIKGWEKDSYRTRIPSIIFFVGAILCKEFGLMILPIFFLSDRYLFKKRRNLLEETTSFLPFILILVLYLMLRKSATSSLLIPSGLGNLWERVYFSPYILVSNLKLILLPYDLHGFIVSYPRTYLNWQAFAGFLGIALLGTFMFKVRKNSTISFSFFCFLIALFPVINIVPASAVTLISMRWLYFPMIFISLAVSIFIKKLTRINHFLTLSALCLVVIYFGAYSYILNRNLWHDEDTFFVQEILRFKNNFYAYGYAVNLLNKKEYREAERYFQIAIKHYPHQAKNYINYSALLIQTNRPSVALSYLEKAKQLTMTHDERGQLFNNIGMAHFHLKDQDEALKNFLKAVTYCPDDPEFWANLGGAYGSMGDYANSVSVLEKGLEIAPKSLQLRKNLAMTYIRMEDYERVVSLLEKMPLEDRDKLGINQLLYKAQKRLLSK